MIFVVFVVGCDVGECGERMGGMATTGTASGGEIVAATIG